MLLEAGNRNDVNEGLNYCDCNINRIMARVKVGIMVRVKVG